MSGVVSIFEDVNRVDKEDEKYRIPINFLRDKVKRL